MYWLIVALLAEFWFAGFFWLFTYFKFCKVVGFKTAIITSLNFQIDLAKKFLLFLIGYNENLKIKMFPIVIVDADEKEGDNK